MQHEIVDQMSKACITKIRQVGISATLKMQHEIVDQMSNICIPNIRQVGISAQQYASNAI